MHPEIGHRVLVVDDEALVRQMTMRSLARAGFRCEPAASGLEAMKLVKESPYDLVVTDLRMPEENGHSLAVALLAGVNRPAIIVLTGVTEPKIAKDLVVRGVDYVLFKPVDYGELIAKAKTAITHRASLPRSQAISEPAGSEDSECNLTSAADDAPRPSDRLAARQIASDVSGVTDRLPTPPKSFDGFEAASSGKFNEQTLALAIAQDPAFAVEVLRLANRVLYSTHELQPQPDKSAANFSAASHSAFHSLWPAVVFAAGTILGWALRSFASGG